MTFGLATLVVLYDLLVRRSERPWLAAALVAGLGLTQAYWVHSVVAEVYSLYALFVALILWWVLKDERDWTLRDWPIAVFILGLGVEHHRAVAFLLFGLAAYLWPIIRRDWRRMPRILLLGTLVFCVPFIAYLTCRCGRGRARAGCTDRSGRGTASGACSWGPRRSARCTRRSGW